MRGAFPIIIIVLVLGMSACSSVSREDVHDLTDANPITRQEAIDRIAGHVGGPVADKLLNRTNAQQAVELMIELFHDCEKCTELQLNILSALGALTPHVELPTSLWGAAVKHNDARVCARAVEIAAKARNHDAVPILIECVENNTLDSNNKYAAIWALGEIRGQEAVSCLKRLLKNDDEYIHYNAYQALAKIAKNEASSGGSERTGKHPVLGLGETTLNGYKLAMAGIFKKIVSLKSMWVGV